jgi:hypothetical protein
LQLPLRIPSFLFPHSRHPPEFTPGARLTQELFKALKPNELDFLWLEMKLAAYVLKVNKKVGPPMDRSTSSTTYRHP